MNPDPFAHIPREHYIAWWQAAFDTVFQGFWAKLIATALLCLGLWLLVNKRQTYLGALLLFILFTIAYGSPALRSMGLMK